MSRLLLPSRWFFALLCGLSLLACPSAEDGGEALTALSISPTAPSMMRGATQAFTATARYASGSSLDVSAKVAWSSSNPEVVSLAGNVAKGVAAGSATVRASFEGREASTDVVVKAPEIKSIAISPPAATVAKSTRQAFTAIATYADDLTLDVTSQATWKSSTPAVASVSATGVALGLSAGSATVTASFEGKEDAARLTVTDATLKQISLNPISPSIPKGTEVNFTATGTFSDDTKQDLTAQARWTSSNPAVATVSAAGLATGVSVGEVSITAELNGQKASTALTVKASPLVSIPITPGNPTLAKGTALALTATGTFEDNTTGDLTRLVSWTSSAPDKVAVSNAEGTVGTVTAQLEGEATLTALLNDVKGTTVVKVTPATLQSIGVTPVEPSLAKGTTLKLSATGRFTDGSTQDLSGEQNLSWKSSNTSVATISNASTDKGLATAATPGTTTLTATFNGISGATVLTVTPATLKSITVSPTSRTLAPKTRVQLTATGIYSDDSTQPLTGAVTWASSSEGVAVVSNAAGSAGLVLAVARGTASITATLGTVVSAKASIKVTGATLTAIAVTPAGRSIPLGSRQRFTATGTFSDGSKQDLGPWASWSTSDPSVVSMSSDVGFEGLATGLKIGEATVNATYAGVNGATQLKVTAATLLGIDVSPLKPTVAKGLQQPFVATGRYTDGTTADLTSQVTWSSSKTAVAEISTAAGSAGVATAKSKGETVISATQGLLGGVTILTVTDAVLVRLEVTPPELTIAKGLTQAFKATGIYSDETTNDLTAAVTWESSAPAVASISNADDAKGLATALGVGTATLSAKLGTEVGQAALTVSAATLTGLQITPVNASIPKGLTQQCAAIGTYTDNSTQDLTAQVTWSSTSPTVASISNAAGSQGLAEALKVGETTLGAQFDGKEATTVLTVTSATLKSIDLTPKTPSIPKGTTLRFKAVGTFTDGTTQDLTKQDTTTWSSSAPAVASVSNVGSSRGVATALEVGTSEIKVQVGGVSAITLLTVNEAVLVSVKITPSSGSLPRGLTLQLHASGTYSDGKVVDLDEQVTWSSSDDSVAIISNAAGSKGLVSGLSSGFASIGASLGGKQGLCSLIVTGAVLVKLELAPLTPSVSVGGQVQLKATGTYSDNSVVDLTRSSSLTWKSSNAAVAQVSNQSSTKGLTTALAVGTTTMSATASSLTSSTTLTVVP